MRTEATPVASASRTAWMVVALLVPVALLNYLDRQMLAAMKTSRLRDHATRNLIHYASQLGWFFALTLIPIGQVVAIDGGASSQLSHVPSSRTPTGS